MCNMCAIARRCYGENMARRLGTKYTDDSYLESHVFLNGKYDKNIDVGRIRTCRPLAVCLCKNDDVDLEPFGDEDCSVIHLCTSSSHLEGLRHNTSIVSLDISMSYTKDIEPLRHNRTIKTLFLCGRLNRKPLDLDPLRHNSSIETLYLDFGIRPTDDTFIFSTMINLTELHLRDGTLKNIDFMRDNVTIVKLDVSQNDISSLEPLRGNTTLTHLDAGLNAIANVDTPDNIVYLNLYRNKISSLDAIHNTHLICLNVAENTILSLEPLQGNTTIKELNVRYNPGIDMSTIGRNDTIEILDIGRCNIQTIDFMRNFSAVKKLIAPSNEIANIDSIKDNTMITDLNFYNNRIDCLSPLIGNTTLTTLSIGDNRISTIEALRGCSSLISLNISDNTVSDTSPLEMLTHLQILNLSNNRIEFLGNLNRLEVMTTLYMHGNNISNLKSIEGCTRLAHLDIEGSNVSDLSPLKEMKSLCTLCVGGNPIAEVGDLPKSTTLMRFYGFDTPHFSEEQRQCMSNISRNNDENSFKRSLTLKNLALETCRSTLIDLTNSRLNRFK